LSQHTGVYCSTIHNSQAMESAQVPYGRWMGREYTVNAHSRAYAVLYRNETVSPVGKWLKLEFTMLREINQTQKDNITCLSHTQNLGKKTMNV
jgi:hypothetical protein